MRVGLVAPPWVTVPPSHYGGTEAVLDSLAVGLQRAGHDVELFTVGDSGCPVPRRWVFEQVAEPMNTSTLELRHVHAAYDALGHCDVIHDHTTVGPVWAAAVGVEPPVVTTLHGAVDETTRDVYGVLGRFATLTAISYRQRDLASGVPIDAVVHHGVDPDRFPVGRGAGGYLMFVGRMHPDKGVHRAVSIARRAGVPLRIATKMREPVERKYFHECVEPLLGPDVTLLGEVDVDERNRQLAEAIALLNPIQWEEPFGMVMVEALATGTPVLASPRGAAPEIVEDGVTGFLGADDEELVSAVSRVGGLDRKRCRAAVEDYFSVGRMVSQYVEVYERVLGR